MGLSLDKPYAIELTTEHRQWLGGFDPQYLANWEKLLKSDAEAAMCEAGVRRLLHQLNVDVSPNEDLTGNERRADFACSSNGEVFFVEVACVPIEKAEQITGLSDGANVNVARNPTPLNGAIHRKCKSKASQCSNHTAPVLLAIGTWHSHAAILSFMPPYPDMLLTGITTMTVFLDKETLQSTGEPRYDSDLESAAFIRRSDDSEFEFARSSISGLLLCGLSSSPILKVGVLHPNPARAFSPSVLPDIPFGQVQLNYNDGTLHVQWPEGSND